MKLPATVLKADKDSRRGSETANSKGEVKLHNAPADVVDYGPAWPRLFVERDRVEAALGEIALRVAVVNEILRS